MDKALRYMTLARKAGRLAVGETGCGAAFASGKARLLLLASDASESTRKRAKKMLYGRRAPLRTLPWSRAELSELLGKNSCGMMCFTDLPLASRFASSMSELLGDWSDTAELLSQREAKAVRRKAAPRKH